MPVSLLAAHVRCDCVFDLSARQFQRRQFPEYATFRTGFFGLVSGTTNCLHCTFRIHKSIAQQNAYTCSLAGMFKGYAMSRHYAKTCGNSSVYPHTTLAVPDACAPFGAERRLLRRRLMIDHFPTVSLQVPHVHITPERVREHPARDV